VELFRQDGRGLPHEVGFPWLFSHYRREPVADLLVWDLHLDKGDQQTCR